MLRDFLKQVFVDNLFHADPHPGNPLVESDGRLVYLDFGTVGRLDPPARGAGDPALPPGSRDPPDMAVEAVLEVGVDGSRIR